MSDLNTKVKDMENEKKSLVTVIKLLQTESTSTNTVNSSPIEIEQNDEFRNEKIFRRNQSASAVQMQYPDFVSRNRFSVLNVEDLEHNLADQSITIVEQSTQTTKQNRNQSTKNSGRRSSTIEESPNDKSRQHSSVASSSYYR